MPGCSCDRSINTRKRREAFQWGGCSEDVIFGCQFSQDFVDAAEDGDTASSKLNIHNNQVSQNKPRPSEVFFEFLEFSIQIF